MADRKQNKKRRSEQLARRTTQRALQEIESRLENEEINEIQSAEDSITVEHFHIENERSASTLSEEQEIYDVLSVTNAASYESSLRDAESWEYTYGDESLSAYDENEATNNGKSLQKNLAEWAISSNVPLITVTKLLGVLRKHNIQVPAQGSTLLRTPRSVNVIKKSGGDYIYLGLEKGITNALCSMQINDLDVIELSINIDGLPIYKSAKSTLWPIQCIIANVQRMKPFVVALYCSHEKPQNLDYLEDFVDELKELMEKGISINKSQQINVRVRCFTCDAPAKALIKGIVQYNGRYGCDYCDVRGEHFGTMVFLYIGTQRTDESFRQQTNPQHHKFITPLLKLNIDMIKQFPLDPMHCIDLGVTRKLILRWKEGPLPTRVSAGQIGVISTYHCALRPFMPPEFNRKPRGLQDVRMWKATEFRTFLMYTGPVVLKHILPHRMYTHFMSLSVAVCLLYNTSLIERYKAYAHNLLSSFVDEARKIYGEKFLTYNVHCLQHLTDFGVKFEGLQNCNAYQFENHMSEIKSFVRGSKNPIVQICHRLIEKEQVNLISSIPPEKKVLPRTGKCYKLKNGLYCTIHEIQTGDNRVLCEVYKNTSSFYTTPCDSRIIGVHKVSTVNTDMQYYNIKEIDNTMIFIPLSLFDRDESNSAILIPLMHTL